MVQKGNKAFFSVVSNNSKMPDVSPPSLASGATGLPNKPLASYENSFWVTLCLITHAYNCINQHFLVLKKVKHACYIQPNLKCFQKHAVLPTAKHLLTNILMGILSKTVLVSSNEDIFGDIRFGQMIGYSSHVLESVVIVGKFVHLRY